MSMKRRSIMPVGAQGELTEVQMQHYYDTTNVGITLEYIPFL